MSLKPNLALAALVIVCFAAIALAAEAPSTAPAGRAVAAAPAERGDDTPLAAGMEDEDDSGLGRPGRMAHLAQALDLTDAQRQKFADIHERQMRRDIQARADIQIARLDLRKALTAEKPEAAAINTQIDRIARLRTEMAKGRVATMLEGRAMLTPEQQKKMRELHMHLHDAGMPGGGRGFGRGPGGMGDGGMRRGGAPMHERIERDTVIRR